MNDNDDTIAGDEPGTGPDLSLPPVPAHGPTGDPDLSLRPPGEMPTAAGPGFCHHCGAALASGATFCGSCGQRTLATVGQPVPPPPPRPQPAAPPPPGTWQATPPGPPQAAYAHAGPVAAPQSTNGFAIAGLVIGILSLFFWLGSILALIFGYVAKGQIDRSNGTQGGRGMAIAAIVLGWIGVGLLILIFVIVIIGAATSPG